MLHKLRGLLALLGLLAIVVGMPALLIGAARIGAPSITWTPDGIWRALSTPDNGTLALALFKGVGWVAWAILTAAVLLEVAALSRHTPAPQLRGFGVPQLFARRLVATAAALFVATSTMTLNAAPTPTAQAAGQERPTHAQTVPGHNEQARNDKQAAKPATYTVKKGDTLSEIALDKTGRAANYPKLFKASKDTVQPGGRRLTDPDMIDIGWKITIPADPAHHDNPTPAKDDTRTPTATPTPVATPTQAGTPPGTTPAAAGSASAEAQPSQLEPAEASNLDAGDTPVWVLSGLAGAGGLLAGGLWLALGRRRAAQFRSRRPGRMIAVPPPELAPVEKTLMREGSPTGALVVFIDEVMRRTVATFTAAGHQVPVLVGLDAHPDHLTIRLRSPADLPAVWRCLDHEARQIWRIDADADLALAGPLQDDDAPPWPQLVTLGRDANGWRLVNLEALGVVSLTGDPMFCQDLARYLVTELAVSPWARDVEIDCLAICPELPGLAPARVRFHTEASIVADRVASAVDITDRLDSLPETTLETARVSFAGDELWDSRLLVSSLTDAEHLDVLARMIADNPGRTASAVLLVAADQHPAGIQMRLTSAGRIRVPALDLDLVVNGLTEDEALGCVAVMAAGDDLTDAEIPVVDDPDREEWAQFCDEAGSLRVDLTVPRGSDVAGASSLLPEPDHDYLTETANTAEDLAELAPLVPITVTERIEASDPTLDADLAEWWSASSTRPRLQVLGPIKVRVGTTGSPVRAAARPGACTEAVAYLNTRPGGATTQQVADALAISTGRVRRDMSIVRLWLGLNSTTGTPFLPVATKTPHSGEAGTGLYLIEDLLCDADLFKRLRLRGEARGADGLNDLRLALRLVNGAPYDGLRTKGGLWLAENRLDQHLLCGIVDVAHMVSTIALQTGDLQQARAAAELAALSAPAEATPQLDLAAIAARAGHPSQAADIARAVVTWKNPGGDGTLDLSQRAEAILRTHRWLEKASRAS